MGHAAMGTIVVGVDETPEATAALRRAAEEAATRGARLTVVLAWDLLSQHHVDPGAPFDPHYGEADARAALDRIVERALGPYPAVPVERRVVCDLPVRALVQEACHADLLVVGCRDRHGIRRLLDQSVSTGCRRHRPCPMLIVHHDGHSETLDLTPAGRGAQA